MRSYFSLVITTYSRLVSGSVTWTGEVSAVCSWSLVSSMLMAVSFPASYPFSYLPAISSTGGDVHERLESSRGSGAAHRGRRRRTPRSPPPHTEYSHGSQP